jgi:TfoX/Sxy family transcriptional regulator of competence genes
LAYSERLAERVRTTLLARDGVSERKMFGGLAFMIDGNMCVGVMNGDLMVRTTADKYEDAVKRAGARPMDFTGRVSRNMVYVAPAATSRAADLLSWIEVGIDAVNAARAKKRRAGQTGKRRT